MSRARRYITRQSTVTAKQWDGTTKDATTIIRWVNAGGGSARWVDYVADNRGPFIAVKGGVSETICYKGDYVVKSPGGFWARSADRFEETFELFDPGPSDGVPPLSVRRGHHDRVTKGAGVGDQADSAT